MMKQAELVRATNRVLINELFDGWPPYTEEEAKENGINVNVNWKEGTILLWQARRQWENAFTKPSNYFTVSLNKGPAIKRKAWGRIITQKINRVLKRSWPYYQLVCSKGAGVMIHGTAAQFWGDKYDWLPYFVPVEDLLIPTDAECSLQNLVYFAIRREYTVGELYRMTHGKKVDKGWNLKAVKKLLYEWRDYNTNPDYYTWSDSPEKLSELYKQNLTYFESDKAPTIPMWDLFYQEDDSDSPGWYRKMLLDHDGPSTTSSEFIYTSRDRTFAEELAHTLHIQFADGSNKPPFKYHTVRSLGFLLYDVCQMSNRLRCEATQHVFDSLMALFRINDPSDRDRVKKIMLARNKVLEGGVQMIPRQERHQIDDGLLETMLAQYKQLMGEASASYTQESDTGTQKEQTATEVMAKVNQVNALLSSMLTKAYFQETFAYTEICRRFCIRKSLNSDVQRFRAQCLEEGIPEEVLDVEYWDVEPEQVLGSGNKVLEVAQANQLMAWRQFLGPEAQQQALHIGVEAVTDNPQLADELAPMEAQQHVSDAIHHAEMSFGTLMQGVDVQPRPGLNLIETVETWLRMMGQKVQQITQMGGVGTPQDVIGLQTVAKNIGSRIQMIGQDENEKQRVKQYGDVLGKLMNLVKAFTQRQQEAAQQQNGHQDPETMAKIQSEMATTKVKLQSKEAASKQRLRHNEAKFRQQQVHEQERTKADLFKQGLTATLEAGTQAAAKRYKAFSGGDDE